MKTAKYYPSTGPLCIDIPFPIIRSQPNTCPLPLPPPTMCTYQDK